MNTSRKEIQLSDHFNYPTLLRFTIPSILMMVISSCYSIVDGLFISNFAGSDAFAAVNLIMPVAMLISCFGFMAGMGGSALVSKTFGEKQERKAREYFSLIVYLVLLFSVVVGVSVYILIPAIAGLMGAKGAIYDNCIVYGHILIAALPAFMLQILFQNFLVVAERPKMGMVIALSSGVTNIALDALFVAKLGWGVGGAAAATVMGQMIGGVVPFAYFLLRKNKLLWFTRTRFEWNAIRQVITNGFAGFISNASASVLGIVFNLRLMALIGSDGVVAYGVVMYVNYITTGIFNGYSTGIAPVFSYNLGADNQAEIKSAFRKSLVVIAGFSVFLVAAGLLFARELAAIFVSYDKNLMVLTTEAIRLYGLSFLLCGFNIFAIAYFAALSKGLVSSTLSLVRTLVFQLLSVIALPIAIGSNGIWLSAVVAESLTLAVTILLLFQKSPAME
ncbi:MAG: MATE family efflux transporter [Lachnospiraceae bacterium]|nr:MATE family efflux transporter [Lachnospiraceae bacterium]